MTLNTNLDMIALGTFALAVEVYTTDGDHWQIDTKVGSFEFSPSRLQKGGAELRSYWPETPEVRSHAHNALIASVVACI